MPRPGTGLAVALGGAEDAGTAEDAGSRPQKSRGLESGEGSATGQLGSEGKDRGGTDGQEWGQVWRAVRWA